MSGRSTAEVSRLAVPVLVLATLFTPDLALSEPTPYGHHLEVGRLYRSDLTFETAPSQVLDFDGSTPEVYSLTEDLDGTLWGNGTGALGFPVLVHLDPTAGTADILELAPAFNITIGPGGRLFGWAGGVREIDRATGTSRLLFVIPVVVEAMAGDEDHLYAAATCNSPPLTEWDCHIVRIDLDTQTVEGVAMVSDWTSSMAVDATGDIWTLSLHLDDHQTLVRSRHIDPETGRVSLVGERVTDPWPPPGSGYYLNSLAMIDIEPDVAALDVPTLGGTGLATMVLLLAGAGLVATRRRRRIE